ncbi:hypothetical protein BH18ACI4_BH18ACI4_25480 [soil metagenome]
MVFMLAVRQSSALDPDLWWHLQTAKDIVATRSIPHTDNYSFTKAGSEWITHEWLSELLMYAIYRVSGLGGLVLVFSGAITAAFLIVYHHSAGRPYLAVWAVMLAALSSTPLFGIRAQMITLLLASGYLALLNRFAREGQTRILWWLPPLMALWVNLHAGFALGLGLIALYFFSLALDRKWKLLRPLTLTGLACFLVVPLNPNGFRIFLYPLQTLTSPSMAALIDEWLSPDFLQTEFLPLAALLLLTFAILAFAPGRLRLGELFLLLVTAFGSLRSARHAPIFALVAAPIFADHLSDLMKTRGWDKSFARETYPTGGKLIVRLLLLIVPVSFATFQFWHFVSHQQTYVAQRNPIAAVDFIEARRLPGPIYNRYDWGGYLIYRLYPEYRVFVDGRADVYGDDFLFQVVNTYHGHSGWREPLDRYGIRTVLISPDVPLASLLRNDPEWQKAYEDNQAVIFTKVARTIPGAMRVHL